MGSIADLREQGVKIKGLEGRSGTNSPVERFREENIEEHGQNLRDLHGDIKHTKIHVMGVPGGEGGESTTHI